MLSVFDSFRPPATLVMAKSDPAIEISADLLQRLHRIYRQRSDIQAQIDRCPRQIAAGEAQVQKCHDAIAESRETILRTSRLANQKQLQLKEREARLFDLQGKMNQVNKTREYELLKEQIAADEQANSVLSDEILELLERLDQLEIERQQREQAAVQREQEQQTMAATVNQRSLVLQDDLARVEAERQQAEALVPAAAKSEYSRLVTARGEDALAPIDGETCGGCYQLLTTQLRSQIRLSRLVRCPSCNAYLYDK